MSIVLCKRSFDSLGALGGDRQIPDSRRDLTIPAERLNPQNFGHALLVQCQLSFAGLETCCKVSQNEQKAIRGGQKWDRKNINIK